MYLRYWIFDEDNQLVRKMASRIECEPYLRTGCTLFIAPKPKEPTHFDRFNTAFALVGDCLI